VNQSPAAHLDIEEGDVEAREQAEETADLKRRVIVGAILSFPVLFAVMAVELFGATCSPDILMNNWVQLALITPVMVYTGWPIHRPGWQALLQRYAEMNALIALYTIVAYGYSLVEPFFPCALPANVREVYSEAVGVIISLFLPGRL